MVDILFWATQPRQDSSYSCENQIQLLTKAQHPHENYIFNGFAPARRCPTTSARLPFLTLVIKAPSLPVSVIFPPTTWKKTRRIEHRVPSSVSVFQFIRYFFSAQANFSQAGSDLALNGEMTPCLPWGRGVSRPRGAWLTSCLAWCVQSGGRPLWMAAM